MKSILKHERRNMAAITIFFSFVVLSMGNRVYSQMVREAKDVFFQGETGNAFTATLFVNAVGNIAQFSIYVAIPLILVTAYLHGRDQRGPFMATLPVKRERIFMARWLTGMWVYTIPWLLLSIQVIVSRLRYDAWYQEYLSVAKYGKQFLGIDNVFNLCMYLIYMWMILTLIYAVTTFILMYCRSAVLGSLISYGIVIFPVVMSTCYGQLFGGNGTYPWPAGIFLIEMPLQTKEIWDSGLNSFAQVNYFNHLFLVLAGQLLFIILLFLGSYRACKRMDATRKDSLIYHELLRKIILAGVCFSVVSILVVEFFDMKTRIGSKGTLGIIAILFFLSYEGVLAKIKERRRGK